MKKVKLVICPSEEKMKILSSRNSKDGFINTRFMSKEEFFKHYFYDYDVDVFYYLMKTYHWHLDVMKEYLSYLPVISTDEKYIDEKLVFLQKLKIELESNNYISKNSSFHKYLNNCEIEVVGYYDLDLYEERILNYSNHYISSFNGCCYGFQTMEEEVSFVCSKIRKLLKRGVDISHIFLTNVSSDYYYTIQKLFSFYQIPINIPYKNSLYTTNAIVEYLKTGEIPEDTSDEIVYKVIQVFNQFTDYSLDDEIIRELLIDRFKHTYLDNLIIDKAVSICDLKSRSFTSDDYVFVVGFNQESLPIIHKDDQYLGDSLKEKVAMYTSLQWNQKEKKIVSTLLSNIENLYLSYKLETPFMSYYPSSFLAEKSISIITDYPIDYSYSHIYNKIQLAEKLDTFTVYGEKEKNLELLNSNYTIPYLNYSHAFTGILKDSYLNHITYPLTLSYTALNSYNECRFAYYLKYVLKVDSFQDSFASYIGSMYHHILSLWKDTSFDLEEEYQSYLQKREFSFKEKVLLFRIKKDLLELIDVLKQQQLIMGYDNLLTEEKIEVDIPGSVAVKFVGYIDKILFYKKVEDTYFAIIDYKTGNIDTHIEPLKYGLHMQLPVYLYLLNYGRVFTNPIFTGIYYQNILFPYPTWSLKLEKEKKERYYLQGYSTDQIDQLERFDSTYENSELIKSLKYSDKGFGAYSKVIDSDTLYSLVQYTKKTIEDRVQDIINADFNIDPKIYAGNNISCRFCTFQDICFHKEYDNIYLNKVDDLSFLGGEE